MNPEQARDCVEQTFRQEFYGLTREEIKLVEGSAK